MKVAILSMQRIVNYGSVLQAYSLKKLVEESGAEVSFLDIQEDDCIDVEMPVRAKDEVTEKLYRKRTFFQRAKEKLFRELCTSFEKKLVAFMDEEFKTCKKSDRVDCVIVGSDEVFNARNDRINLQMFGHIEQAQKIISYAASCGCSTFEGIPKDKVAVVSDALKNFSAMSVRDEGTYSYIHSLYEGEIQYHLDPVLMWDLYKREHKKVLLKNYMIVYAYSNRIRTKEEIEAIKAFAKKKHLKTLALGGTQFWTDYYLPVSALRMLDYFYAAEYVVTDTFHGTIFSVINHKKFVLLPRKTNNNKVVDLTKRLGLEARLVDKLDELEERLVPDIDYKSVETILDAERKRTREYLAKHLS